jgi:hypothetical protein
MAATGEEVERVEVDGTLGFVEADDVQHGLLQVECYEASLASAVLLEDTAESLELVLGMSFEDGRDPVFTFPESGQGLPERCDFPAASD